MQMTWVNTLYEIHNKNLEQDIKIHCPGWGEERDRKRHLWFLNAFLLGKAGRGKERSSSV